MGDKLSVEVWAVCFNPSDYPRKFTARRSIIKRGGETLIADEVIVRDTIGEVRRELAAMGLTRFNRQEGDDPVIVESWL